MKAIKEHLEELPEPYRGQALENTKSTDLNVEVDDIVIAIESAFFWSGTEQGHHYWWDLTKELAQKE